MKNLSYIKKPANQLFAKSLFILALLITFFNSTNSLLLASTNSYQYLKIVTTDGSNIKINEIDWLVGSITYPTEAMTSNNSAGAVASGGAGSLSYQAFDNDTENHLWVGDVTPSTPYEFIIDLGSAIDVTGVRITRGEWSTLRAFEAHGSNDGENWTLLHTETELTQVSSDETIEVVFEDTPPTYTLTVNSGIGDGSYEENVSVEITADAAPSEQEFDKWTGNITNVVDINAVTTTISMPTNNVVITATYKDIPEGVSYQYLKLIAENGSKIKINEIDWMSGSTSYPTSEMTSNNSAGAVASGGAESLSYKAFDNDLENHLWIGDDVPYEFVVDLGSPIDVTGVKLTRGGWSKLSEFTAHGSNNGVDWTLLHTETGITDVSDTPETMEVSFENIIPLTTYMLNVYATNGSVVKSPDKALYTEGEIVTLTATPNTGYTFDGWGSDASGLSSTIHLTMTKDMAITTSFLANSASYAGSTEGSFSVNSGTAMYNMPITVSPGTAGIQPYLSISYSSGSGNAYLGLGFGITGLSSITRGGSDKTNSAAGIDGPDYDDNDKYYLDGQLLVAINGVYGANNTEYRTETESFTKVISYGTAGSGPSYFAAWTKDGLKYLYGASVDSRVEAQGRVDVVSWKVQQISDTKTNIMTFSYFENIATGESYITEVKYSANMKALTSTSNSIKFNYEDRSDPSIHYYVGSKSTISKRLKNIKVYHLTDLVRTYNLGYQTSGNNISQLVSVQECGSDNKCFKPTVFEWETAPNGTYNTIIKSTLSSSDSKHYTLAKTADVNGDGLVDLVWEGKRKPGFRTIKVSISKGNGKYELSRVNFVDGDFSGRGIQNYIFGDVNGDGRTDLIWVQRGDSQIKTIVSLADENGRYGNAKFSSIYEPDASFAEYQNATAADINGDGLTDLIWTYKGDGLKVITSESQGNGFFNSVEKSTIRPNGNTTHYTSAVTGDVNGDGIVDVIWSYLYKPGTLVQVSLGRNDGSYESFIETKFTDTYLVKKSLFCTDVNGDGLSDMVWVSGRSEGVPRDKLPIYVSLSNGNGTFRPIQESIIPSSEDIIHSYNHSVIADVNHDGFSDVVWSFVGKNGLWTKTSLSNGDGTFALSKENNNYNQDGSIDINAISYWALSGIVNKDGQTDIIWISKNENGYFAYVGLAISGGNKLIKLTDGLGKKINITYHSLLGDNIFYSRNETASYPNMIANPSSPIVTSYNVSNGYGGYNTVRFEYHNLVVDLSGRGSLGFSWIKEIDVTSGVKTKTSYSQDYHNSGMPIAIETCLSNDICISKVKQTYTNKNFDTGVNSRWFTYLSSQTEYSYKIDGTLIDTKRSGFLYDDNGNLTSSSINFFDGHRTHTANWYADDVSKWFLGRLRHSQITMYTSDVIKKTSHAYFEYDATSGMLVKEIMNKGDADYELIKEYVHDDFGNVIHSKLSGNTGWHGSETRTVSTTYDPLGRFVISSTNDLGHKETYTYDQLTGNILSRTGPNNLTATYTYDGMGRKIKETRADGNTTNITYAIPAVGENVSKNTAYTIKSQIMGQPTKKVCFDNLNRLRRTQKNSFGKNLTFINVDYDAQGRSYRTSLPYFVGTDPQWVVTSFDELNRPVSITSPLTGEKTVSYDGHITTFTNELGQRHIEERNNVGQVIKVTDHRSNIINYAYDPKGNLTTVTDMEDNVTSMQYDINGNKIYIDDPDAGVQRYYYNAFGEMWKKTDNLGNSVIFKYDILGRATEVVRPEETVTYTYATEVGITGKLKEVLSTTGYSIKYSYDSYGRFSSSTEELLNKTFTTSNTYDKYGRIDELSYPSGFKIKNEYDASYHLIKVKRASDGFVYYQADKANPFGQATEFTLGNGLQTQSTFDDLGRLTNINTGNGTVQNLDYTYNDISNLTSRKDNIRQLEEEFTYDVLDRLKSSKVINNVGSVLGIVHVICDEMGNITYKNNYGCYTYAKTGNAGPHAVTSVSGRGDYTYDKNGNLISSPYYTASYTSFNKPSSIIRGETETRFKYNPGNGRYHQEVLENGVISKEIFYVGGIYEKIITPSGILEKHYISASGSVIAVYTKSTVSDIPEETVYLHKDNLGSIVEITDANSNIKESFSYDSWGKRRNPIDWTSKGTINNSPFYDRGYTNHEHLDEIGLVHMNGRVYDPSLARFLSADPYVQSMYNGQSLNRYSYVLNSPMMSIDPSGFWSLSRAVNRIGKELERTANNILKAHTVVGKAYVDIHTNSAKAIIKDKYGAIICQAAASYFGQSWLVPIIAAAHTRLNGGTWEQSVKAGAFAAASAAGSSAIGSYASSNATGVVAKGVMHGAFQGALTEAQGGKFKHGFMAGFSGSVGGEYVKTKGGWQAVGINAIVSGTASKLGGGKFSNGAMSGAMIMIFNHMGDGLMGLHANDKTHEENLEEARDKAREYAFDHDWDMDDVDFQLFTENADGPSVGAIWSSYMSVDEMTSGYIHDIFYGSATIPITRYQADGILNITGTFNGFAMKWGLRAVFPVSNRIYNNQRVQSQERFPQLWE